MPDSWFKKHNPAVLLGACTLLAGITDGASAASKIPSHAVLPYRFAYLLAAGYWLLKDRQAGGVRWVWDMGLFLYAAWPIILGYHLFRTRRATKTLLIVLGFIGIYFGGLVFGWLLERFR